MSYARACEHLKDICFLVCKSVQVYKELVSYATVMLLYNFGRDIVCPVHNVSRHKLQSLSNCASMLNSPATHTLRMRTCLFMVCVIVCRV
jgi:hypothetical protein